MAGQPDHKATVSAAKRRTPLRGFGQFATLPRADEAAEKVGKADSLRAEEAAEKVRDRGAARTEVRAADQ